MSNLSEQKLEEEIALLKIDRKAAKLRIILDISKAISLILGAIIVFWFIQQPESILNRASSQETIARERAKLMLEWIKEKDPEKQANALAVIKAAYGESGDSWIRNLEARLESKAQTSAVESLLKRHAELTNKAIELKHQMKEEIEGTGGTKTPGMGLMYAKLKHTLAMTEFEIMKILQQLETYGFDVSKITR